MKPCVFCAIAQGAGEAEVVARADGATAFLDLSPLFKGHVLVIPDLHVETLADLDAAHLRPLFGLAQRAARAVEIGLGAGGSFIAINNRVSQSVPHLHVHVVPRSKGDGLKGFFWPRSKYAAGERALYAEKLRAALAQASA